MGHANRRHFAVLILLLAASFAHADQARLPVPSADEQAAVRPTVGQLFADELSSGKREDDIDVAKKLIDRSYRRPIDPAALYLMLIESRNLAVVRKGQLTLQRAEYKAVASQMAELSAHPNDPAANLAVGKYICFIRGDWPAGLSMLIKGSDAHLRDLAHLDHSNPADPDVQESLADQWYGLGNLPTIKGDQVRLRAYYWYQKVSDGMGADAPSKVKARLRELQPLVARRQTSGELWSAIQKALHNKSFARSDIAGGGGAAKDFQDIPAAGAVLIGIRVGKGTYDNYPTVVSFQGIYLTAAGQEVLGKTAGTSKGEPVILKAKPGYAVGAIQARGGTGMDALTLTFMKIKGNHLDPSTAYRSEKVGGNGGNAMDFDGKGMPIIGLCGRTDPSWIGFGVVYLSEVGGRK